MILKSIDKMMGTISAPSTSDTDRAAAIQFAAAVLLIDVARADHEYDEQEFVRVLHLVERHFELDSQAAVELVNRAEERAERVVSIHEFTQFLHRRLDEREKEDIVRLLWQVAYADGHLHPYENSLVQKISDLLYVKRARCQRLKFDATSHVVDIAV